MRPIFALALGLSAAAGCTESTGPAFRASLTVPRDSVTATITPAGTVQWLKFAVPITIQNAGRATVTFQYCNIGIDNRVAGDQWRAAWSPTCTVQAVSPDEIRPGETRELTVEVAAAVEGPGGPRWGSDEIDGTYRVHARVDAADGTSPATLTSNSFVVTQLP
jgi:hypothetical protein